MTQSASAETPLTTPNELPANPLEQRWPVLRHQLRTGAVALTAIGALAGTWFAGEHHARATAPDGIYVQTSIDGNRTIDFSLRRRASFHNPGQLVIRDQDVLLAGEIDCGALPSPAVRLTERPYAATSDTPAQLQAFLHDAPAACDGGMAPDGGIVPVRLTQAMMDSGLMRSLVTW